MSRVHVSLHRDDGTSERTPICGAVRFVPTKRRTAGADIILPAGFDADLVDGEVTVELAATGPDWCWTVYEPTIRGIIRHVVVPESDEVLEYSALIDVDPATLEPSAEPEAAWWAMAGNTVTSGAVVGDDLILTRYDASTVNAGNVRGPQGDQGPANTLSVGTVTTGAAGSSASADITGTAPSQVLSLSIPRGAPGDPTAYELRGTGMPNGVVTASPGTYYTDTAGTNGAWRWLKTSGTGNTGWIVTIGDTGWRSLLTTDLSNGWQRQAPAQILIRRVGARVDFISGSSGIWGTSATSPAFVTLPAGFRARPQPRYVAIGSGFVSGSDTPRKVVSDAMAFTLGLSAVEAGPITFALSWWTDDAWPTALPFSPA